MDSVVNALAAGALVGGTAMAIIFAIRWAYRSAKNPAEKVARSNAVSKVKDSASAAISASSEGIRKTAKTSAEFVKNVSKRDPSARYDALLKLKQLLDAGAPTQDEYETEKTKTLTG